MDSTSRFSNACDPSSSQWRSSNITMSGWLRLSRSSSRLIASRVRRLRTSAPICAERVVALRNLEQSEEVRQCIFQRTIQHQNLAANLFTALADIVFRSENEIVLEQLDQGQIRRGLTVRDRKGLERQASAARDHLELIEQPRLAQPCFRDDRDDLPMTRLR